MSRRRPPGALRIGRQGRVLRATYRLQLHDGFTFADAAAQVGRLAQLGVSHLYLSPSLEAVPGSTHGYDVIDPTRIRASLGGEDGLRALATTAHEAGLGLILDIVPNHVGLVSPGNPWWFDTLAHGPDGRFGRHLDVFWVPGAHGQPTLLVPELGERLPEALAGEALRLDHVDDGRDPAWRIVYHDHQWPVRPGSLVAVGLDVAEQDPSDAEVARAVTACRDDRTLLAALLDHQHYRLGFWKRANDELDHRRFFDIDTLGAVRIEDPAVFADVHAAVLPLLADGTLDGLRIDHPDGLADPVGYVERLRTAVGPEPWLIVEKILEHGERFRADWPVDGTVGYEFADLTLKVHLDPAAGEVLDDLQTTLTGAPFDRHHEADAAKRTALDTLFGAERARLAAALLAADPELGALDLDALARRGSGSRGGAVRPAEASDGPAPAGGSRGPDDHAPAGGFGRPDDRGVAGGSRGPASAGASATADRLLTELLVVWPVYRTYVREPETPAGAVDTDAADHAVIAHAVARASARHPGWADAFARIGSILRGEVVGAAAAQVRLRFQQLTGPAIAKGLEDTVLYRDTRLSAVNEVGSDPGHLDVAVSDLHAANLAAAQERPATMRLLSTHDTKRSADVRARLAVLGQDPGWWVGAVARLQIATDEAWTRHAATRPRPAHQHLAWQTALGAWPIDADRLGAYLVKAAREGKQQTSWLDPDTDYEAGLLALAETLTQDPALVSLFDELVAQVAQDGWATSLAMLLSTVCGAGVPDVYQGDECWSLTLVDPDNRQDVDHDAIRAVQERVTGVSSESGAGSAESGAGSVESGAGSVEPGAGSAAPGAWWAAPEDGTIKVHVLHRALAVRARYPEAFGPGGSYAPVWAQGSRREQVIAAQRGTEVLVVTPARVRTLRAAASSDARSTAGSETASEAESDGTSPGDWDWGDTVLPLPAGRWQDALTGREHQGTTAMSTILAELPVALLVRAAGASSDPQEPDA